MISPHRAISHTSDQTQAMDAKQNLRQKLMHKSTRSCISSLTWHETYAICTTLLVDSGVVSGGFFGGYFDAGRHAS